MKKHYRLPTPTEGAGCLIAGAFLLVLAAIATATVYAAVATFYELYNDLADVAFK